MEEKEKEYYDSLSDQELRCLEAKHKDRMRELSVEIGIVNQKISYFNSLIKKRGS